MNAAFGCSGPLASRMLHSSLGPKLTFTILTNVCDEELKRTHVSSGGMLRLALVVRWQAERCIPPMDLKLDFQFRFCDEELKRTGQTYLWGECCVLLGSWLAACPFFLFSTLLLTPLFSLSYWDISFL